MSEAIEVCGKCLLPIHPGESGVRSFGLYRAHSESRCIELMRARLAATEAQRDTLRALIEGLAVQRFGESMSLLEQVHESRMIFNGTPVGQVLADAAFELERLADCCAEADAELSALRAQLAAAKAQTDALRAAALKAHAMLTDSRIGTVRYMEGPDVYRDMGEAAKALQDALHIRPTMSADGGKDIQL